MCISVCVYALLCFLNYYFNVSDIHLVFNDNDYEKKIYIYTCIYLKKDKHKHVHMQMNTNRLMKQKPILN